MKHFNSSKLTCVVFDDDLKHLPCLTKLHKLTNRNTEWLSKNQYDYCYGFSGAAGESLRQPVTLSTNQQLRPFGFGIYEVQGDSNVVIPQGPIEPNVPTSGGRGRESSTHVS